MVDPVSNQIFCNLKDQQLFTNFHGKQGVKRCVNQMMVFEPKEKFEV